ncbi:hypothetical protein XPA_005933 [Xanthoria parietina]
MASQSAPVVTSPGIYPAPPGVVPNFTNPHVRTGGHIVLSSVFLPLSTLVLALRLYTKIHVMRAFGWDDIMILCAWLCTVPVCAIYVRGLQIGFGAHIWNLTIYHAEEVTKIFLASSILSVLANGLPKLAILAFYLRINPAKSFRYTSYAAILLNAVYILIFICLLLFPCNPVKKVWDPTVPGKCIKSNGIFIAGPIGNTILDLIVLGIPIRMIIKLQVNLRTKIVLAGILFISSCTIIISAVRIWSTFKLQGNPDLLWESVTSSALGVAEINLSLICGSILVLRPFCRRHLPFLLGSSKTHGTPGHDGLNFDGPSGPRSKRGYHAKVSSGGGPSGSGASTARKSGKRGIWNSLGGTLVTKGDDEDLESLSTELAAVGGGAGNPHGARAVKGGYAVSGGGVGSGGSGNASSSGSVVQDPFPAAAKGHGILQTRTVDVR